MIKQLSWAPQWKKLSQLLSGSTDYFMGGRFIAWGGIEKFGGAKFGGAKPGMPEEAIGGGSIGLNPGIPGRGGIPIDPGGGWANGFEAIFPALNAAKMKTKHLINFQSLGTSKDGTNLLWHRSGVGPAPPSTSDSRTWRCLYAFVPCSEFSGPMENRASKTCHSSRSNISASLGWSSFRFWSFESSFDFLFRLIRAVFKFIKVENFW